MKEPLFNYEQGLFAWPSLLVLLITVAVSSQLIWQWLGI